MIRKEGGKIINICSMMSELGLETLSAYASAKGGLKMLTRNLHVNGRNIISRLTDRCGIHSHAAYCTTQGEGNPFNSFILSRTPAGRWVLLKILRNCCISRLRSFGFCKRHSLYVDGGILAYLGKPRANITRKNAKMFTEIS